MNRIYDKTVFITYKTNTVFNVKHYRHSEAKELKLWNINDEGWRTKPEDILLYDNGEFFFSFLSKTKTKSGWISIKEKNNEIRYTFIFNNQTSVLEDIGTLCWIAPNN